MKRFCLTVQYDGSSFHGWQLQKSHRTVQGELESVLEELTGERPRVVGSGRTDQGVHAIGQVASVDLPERWTATELRSALNARLPDAIWVSEARRASDRFHPRYDATARSYEYRVGTGREAASPFFRRWCWDTSSDPPDRELLDEAAQLIPGERSFRRFAKTGQPQRGERCTVREARWAPWSGPGVRFLVTANRYLHHMVRYLVGTMVDVARERRPLAELATMLEEPDAALVTSRPAPAHGLFLIQVEYPPERVGSDPDRDPEPDRTLTEEARSRPDAVAARASQRMKNG